MSTRLPQSKGQRTKSARILDAIADDLRRAASSFQASANDMRRGEDVIGIALCTDHTFSFALNHPLRCYKHFFKPGKQHQ